jgi:DNA polymerase kappa
VCALRVLTRVLLSRPPAPRRAARSYFKEARRRDAATDARCAALAARAATLTPPQLAASARAVATRVRALDAQRDLSRTWLCVDMDAFFASVEIRDAPALAHVPMAVGSLSMITTSNYVARKWGVRAAMPGFIAKKLCPELVFVPPCFDKYVAAAEETRRVFADFDTDFIAGSLDEAYLDVTDYCARQGGISGAEAAARLRAAVKDATRGLTCSAGVAPNRLLAKMASDINKPDGQCVLAPERDALAAFLAPTPVRKVPGIGRVAERLLAAAGATTCGDVLRRAASLALLLSPASFEHALSAALGCGPTARPPPPAPGEAGRKGMSVERTFSNCDDAPELERKLSDLAAALADHLAREGLRARQLTLKLKTAAFEVRTRQTALAAPTCAAADLLPPALRLLRAEMAASSSAAAAPLCCRLMGLRASAFVETRAPPAGQRTLGFEAVAAEASAGAGGAGAGGAGAGEGTTVCGACGAAVAGAHGAQEHADWHAARALHRQLRDEDAQEERRAAAAAKRGRTGGGGGGGGGGIQALFKRAAAQK